MSIAQYAAASSERMTTALTALRAQVLVSMAEGSAFFAPRG